MPKCCIECFAHEWLRNYVRENSVERSQCDYCGREDVPVLDPAELYDPFENLLKLYVMSDGPHGDPLVDLIQSDYEVFDDDLHAPGETARLLEEIMETGWDDDAGEAPINAHDLYHCRSSVWPHTSLAERWNEFRDEVKRQPAHELDLLEHFDEEWARMEAAIPQGRALYRARPGYAAEEYQGRRPYENQEIGAPPPDRARAGRANAEGEVVLYVADQEETAVAEVRPWRGLLVSVAEMRPVRALRIVDLNAAPPRSNPFTDEAPQYERELEELLVAFGWELGRPLRRADDPNDYVPSQRLVRRIRESGLYDGIRYPSAMAPDGTNVVLFDAGVVEIGPSRLVELEAVSVRYVLAEED